MIIEEYNNSFRLQGRKLPAHSSFWKDGCLGILIHHLSSPDLNHHFLMS